MDSNQTTIWALALAFTILAGWLDWRTRRIPNWLTVPAFFAGIVLHCWIAGWHGAAMAFEGAGLALVILLPLVLMRGLGAGDWKLMGAVGAILGPWMFLFVLLASIFVSGLMAMVLMVQTKRVKTTLRNLVVLVQGFLSFGLRVHPEISLDNPGLLKLPFGIAAAIGTVICFLAARWGV
jgi:prepilin peptidase CpaA